MATVIRLDKNPNLARSVPVVAKCRSATCAWSGRRFVRFVYANPFDSGKAERAILNRNSHSCPRCGKNQVTFSHLSVSKE